MTVPHRLLALAGGLLLGLTGCTSFSESADPSATPSATSAAPTQEQVELIAWRDCNAQIQPLIAGQPGADRGLSFECGRTDVPVTYQDADGPTLQLFLVRAVITGQTDRRGSLLVNPGGPGGSGVEAALGLALTMPVEVLQHFDLVGFDPRGVGLSSPVECISPELKDELAAAEPRPVTAEQLDAAFALSQQVADACADEYGEGLGAFNTEDTARDLDRLRQSLGDDQLTYLGYSYGTTLGSTYAELFPEEVRALVLDGAVDPDATEVESAEGQAQGFEGAFDAFAANCTGLLAGCPLGPDPRLFVTDLLAQAAATPIPSSRQGETRAATPGHVLTGVAAALYDADSWPKLAQDLAAARTGDSAGIFTLADSYNGRYDDGTYSNILDANLAINCADTDETYTEAQVRTYVADWSVQYPLFGASLASSLYTCSVWDAPRTPLPERDAEGSAPIVVIGTEGDPATPLAGAVDMAGDLDSGVLLTWLGEGHTAYPKTGCVTSAVNAYLIDLTVPAEGLTCPAA
jgi:pimeloyl-ACP methyl ester carboxylesterase